MLTFRLIGGPTALAWRRKEPGPGYVMGTGFNSTKSQCNLLVIPGILRMTGTVRSGAARPSITQTAAAGSGTAIRRSRGRQQVSDAPWMGMSPLSKEAS